MGDNRPCSADSRSYGPVERKQIKRRVPLPQDFVCALPRPVHAAGLRKNLDPSPAGPYRGTWRPTCRPKRGERLFGRVRSVGRRSAGRVYWLEAFSGGAFVEAGGAAVSGGSPSLARNTARTSGASPAGVSSMRRRTAWSISSKGSQANRAEPFLGKPALVT